MEGMGEAFTKAYQKVYESLPASFRYTQSSLLFAQKEDSGDAEPPPDALSNGNGKPEPWINPLAGNQPAERAFARAVKVLQTLHPKAKFPKPRTRQATEWRKALLALLEADGYPAADVQAVMEWIGRSESEDARFWAAQFQSIPALRKRKNGDTLTKFDKMHEAWKRDKGAAPQHAIIPPRWDGSPYIGPVDPEYD